MIHYYEMYDPHGMPASSDAQYGRAIGIPKAYSTGIRCNVVV